MAIFRNDYAGVLCGSPCGNLPTYTAAGCEVRTMDNISMIYFSLSGLAEEMTDANAEDWQEEWTTRLSNTTSSATAIRFREVNAELPDADPETVTDQFDLVLYKLARRAIDYFDDEDSDANFEWHRGMVCNRVFRFWYEIGGKIYGGQEGIRASFSSVFSNVKSNERPSNAWHTKISWVERGTPPRVAGL